MVGNVIIYQMKANCMANIVVQFVQTLHSNNLR